MSDRSARAATSGSCVAVTCAKPNSRLQRVDQVEHPRAGVGVELAGRLVAEQQRRPLRERPRDRHPLGLAAGQLARQRVELGGEPHQLEQLGRPELSGSPPLTYARRTPRSRTR